MYPDSEFNDMVAVVTGAGNGIGKAITEMLLAAGCRVSAVDFSSERLELLQSNLDDDAAENLLTFQGDASSQELSRSAVNDTLDRWGKIDILVNCAGGSYGYGGRKFVDTDYEAWERTVNGNLFSVFNFTRAVLPVMMDQKSGNVVNIGSTTALGDSNNSGEDLSVYSTTKGGVISFTKAIAREVAEYGIRVNCISPGLTDTDAVKRLPKEMIERLVSLTPLGRICDPADVGNLVLFMISSRASFLTGNNIVISGGLVMY